MKNGIFKMCLQHRHKMKIEKYKSNHNQKIIDAANVTKRIDREMREIKTQITALQKDNTRTGKIETQKLHYALGMLEYIKNG